MDQSERKTELKTSMEKKRQFTVTLVRHGETMSNRQKIMQGQKDTQLSEVGEEQARLVGKRLKDQCFTHAFSSDLSRAANTARQILAQNVKTTCGLTLDQRLRERGFGCLEGRPFTDFKKAQEASGLSHEMFTPEGGETVEQVYHRAKDFFRDLCKLMAEPVKPHTSPEGKDSSPSNADSPPSIGTEAGNQTSLQKKTHGGALTDTSNLIDLSPKSSPTSCGSTSATQVVPESSSSTTASPSSFAKGLTQSESQEEKEHILIVSHGLLIREFKRVILEKFKGSLESSMAQEALSVSPNTGVTCVTVSVNYKYNKLKSQCTECHFFNCTSHLRSSKEDLISQSLFKGAL